ncbi:MAG: alpha/beta fold hydrolase [Actinobacteria bacterium]|nr:MAG: alpha/beta fold hydrolase [Actinomycetota bacterium]
MTLVLLHSAGATPAVWDRVRRHLLGVPAIAPPLPGRAGAGEPSDTVEGHARSVLRAMDAAGIERAAIAGHSLGGGVALWLALEHPARVAGLGLVSTGGRLRVDPRALAALPSGLAEAAPVMAATNFPADPPEDLVEERRRTYAEVGGATVFADLTACDRFDVLDRLWEIRCRTQVLVGSADVLTPPKYARALAERISAARLVEYAGAGHMLPVERPAEVAGELAVLWAASLDGRAIREREGRSAAAGSSWGSPRRTG